MPPIKITSFWYAIYKRLWAVGSRGDAHVSTEIVSDGNFSLETTSTGNGNGIFGTTVQGDEVPWSSPRPRATDAFKAACHFAEICHRLSSPIEKGQASSG